jgi:hypothetical protein
MIIGFANVERNITEKEKVYFYSGNYSNPHVRI